MVKIFTLFCSFFVVLFFYPTFAEQKIKVNTVDEIRKAILTAKPGDVIEIQNGVYELDSLEILQLNGEVYKPIKIKAQSVGNVEFIGKTKFVFTNSSYVVLEGCIFSSNAGPAITLKACNNIRITRNTFHLKETSQSNWIFITGDKHNPELMSSNNRIDHNLFEKKSELGNFITIEGNDKPVPTMSQNDTIDYNHFRDIGPRVENVLEAIRVGSSTFSMSSSYTIIENNLFERCDGDPEVVSIKSCDNIIRYNTFRECLGVMSLRHGNRNTVDGNYFFGNGRKGSFTDSTGRIMKLGTGGVRLYGDSMVVTNNYFEGLTGTEWDAPLSLTSGNADYGMGLPLTKHYRTRFATIAYNVFVNNDYNIQIGFDGAGFQGNWWNLPPSDVTIAHNIIVGSKNKLIEIFNQPVNTTWVGNFVYPTGEAIVGCDPIQGEIEVLNPKLKRKDGIIQLTSKSPKLNTFYENLKKRKSVKPLFANDVGPHASNISKKSKVFR